MNKKIGVLTVIVIAIVAAVGVAFASQSDEDSDRAEEDTQIQNNLVDQSEPSESTNNIATDEQPEEQEENDNSSEEALGGEYIDYAESSLTNQDNVIFFAASWCPTCKVLDDNLMEASSNIPSGVTILKADYDTEDELKDKYGVTYQHTLVQVDQNGNQIKKWTNSFDLEDIIEELNS